MTVEAAADHGGPHARTPSTARAVLQVLRLLGEHPEGVRAEEVAAMLGKSRSTAYSLLASLCDEGFAVHASTRFHPVRGIEISHQDAAEEPQVRSGDLSRAVDCVFARTRKRSYVGELRRGAIAITEVRGRQGLAHMPGLGSRITDNAHALAMGKVVLGRMSEARLARYLERGLERYTDATLAADDLADELRRVREQGYALEREEFEPNFCCIAAPVLDGERVAGVLGVSMSTRTFDEERDALAAAVLDIAAATGSPRS